MQSLFASTFVENFALLQNLILNDIIGSIKANLTVGNITKRDADELISLTLQLYEHIYQHYDELGGGHKLRQLLEGALTKHCQLRTKG